MVTRIREAQIVHLQQARADRRADGLRESLERGHVIVEASSVDSIEAWRAAARSLARCHGWRIRTGVTVDGERLWAARTDLEPSPAQESANRERLAYLGAVISP
ncbi:MAG: hypothetical protein ACRDRT_11765 [Pseudonocardiaceae bacterium]